MFHPPFVAVRVFPLTVMLVTFSQTTGTEEANPTDPTLRRRVTSQTASLKVRPVDELRELKFIIIQRKKVNESGAGTANKMEF